MWRRLARNVFGHYKHTSGLSDEFVMYESGSKSGAAPHAEKEWEVAEQVRRGLRVGSKVFFYPRRPFASWKPCRRPRSTTSTSWRAAWCSERRTGGGTWTRSVSRARGRNARTYAEGGEAVSRLGPCITFTLPKRRFSFEEEHSPENRGPCFRNFRFGRGIGRKSWFVVPMWHH